MTNTIVIGISGKAGTGKDTAFTIMKANKPDSVIMTRRAFADPVKEAAEKYFSNVVDTVAKDALTRRVLQGIGESFRQEIDPHYWINKTLSDLPNDAIVVITDVRYVNEAQAVQSIGGIVVRINGHTSLQGVAAEHPSETSLDDYPDFDYFINNFGTMAEYNKEVTQWMYKNIL